MSHPTQQATQPTPNPQPPAAATREVSLNLPAVARSQGQSVTPAATPLRTDRAVIKKAAPKFVEWVASHAIELGVLIWAVLGFAFTGRGWLPWIGVAALVVALVRDAQEIRAERASYRRAMSDDYDDETDEVESEGEGDA